MPTKVYLLGYPLTYSWSPAMHNAAFSSLKIDAIYELLPTAPTDLASVIHDLRSPSTLGANVTVPYKLDVIPYLTYIDASAQVLGAVNTIVNRNGSLWGYNTDVDGALQALLPFAPAHKVVTLYGAGGAARAALTALHHIQPRPAVINMVNRSAERLSSLLNLLGTLNLKCNLLALDSSEGANALEQAELVINCATDSSALRALSLQGAICDLNYGEKATPLREFAQSRGLKYADGVSMLLYQGAAAFKLWTGQEPPIQVMASALKDVGAGTMPISNACPGVSICT